MQIRVRASGRDPGGQALIRAWYNDAAHRVLAAYCNFAGLRVPRVLRINNAAHGVKLPDSQGIVP